MLEVDRGELMRAFPELELLLLHGSRARGEAHAQSDWDFAYLAGATLDELALRAALVKMVGSDAVDVADLSRAGGLLRYRAAREGELVLEREPGAHEAFAVAAITFWLDAEPTLRAGYEAVLERLG
ncbi:MAG TPA: nucleotidyltransferase domain-containing protein [Polyangiaceae bacterium]|nr:nucleotidyltransferase domain-containing protein [Polyangiaceae bacterium]